MQRHALRPAKREVAREVANRKRSRFSGISSKREVEREAARRRSTRITGALVGLAIVAVAAELGLAADLLGSGDLSAAWPAVLQEHYAAGFSVARRLAILLTVPKFLPLTGPVAMRSQYLMTVAVRAMGNLVTEEDTDAIARIWRRAGRGSRRLDQRKPFS